MEQGIRDVSTASNQRDGGLMAMGQVLGYN
jgi:hypothetical protein